MPITSSAKKALRQTKRRKIENTLKREAYKKAIKTLNKAVEAKDANSKELISTLYTKLDKAAKSNTISKNKAARLKSRAARRAAYAAK